MSRDEKVSITDKMKESVEVAKKERDFVKYAKTAMCGVIPRKVTNEKMVDMLQTLSKPLSGTKRLSDANAVKNAIKFGSHMADIQRAEGYIENQSQYKDMKYGKKTMAFCGCEIIAVYNAIQSLEGRQMIPLDQMISAFEKKGMILSGLFGTSPNAIQSYLEEMGYQTVFSTNAVVFETMADQMDAFILTFYNDSEDITKQIHTIHVEKQNGCYITHNASANGRKGQPIKTFWQLIASLNAGKAKPICLIGIMKNKSR